MALLKLRFAERDFVLDDCDGADLVARQMQQGFYEAPLPMLTMAIIARNQGLFLDVGANDGLYSVLAGITRPDARIVAFEPYPPALDILKINVAANGLSDRVDIRPIALSDSEGLAVLYMPDQRHGLLETSSTLERNFRPNDQKTLEATKAQLDNVELPGSVGLIKADIEGHELAFLEGARKTIARDRPFVFIEVLPPNPHHMVGLTKFIQQMGYMDFCLRKEVAIYSENVAHDPLAWNHALVPRDRLDLFKQACEAHHLRLVRSW
ncbi:methyltransferase FkbM family [Methylocella silvestris BL2]|uniref:Methyltransferase FkbM family n=1 Tax=Methylocella silvestris (strain DSM 15510 / CIP 108128 / LMG 27833 / NCIMB 13906 / BL2) TaxID=395965 RepID=B8ERV8_METSB|nr:FkbM family methyltransferase [Methylocella silvestris]ACK51656.1 methyltransferase FkbM family [Methylocella silvestris BL2]